MKSATRALCVLIVAGVLFSPAASAIDNNCYFKVVDTAVVTTFGYYKNPDGSTTWVPMGSTTYVYWGYECDPSTGEYYPDPPPTTTVYQKPKVTLLSVNNTDPDAVKLLVNVASELTNPAVKIELLVGSSLYSSLPIHWDGNFEMNFPMMHSWADGTKTFTVRSCTANNVCGTGSASVSRLSPTPYSRSEEIATRWLEGDEFKYSQYVHSFYQGYTTTAFSIAELGMNTQLQLRTARTTLYWPQSSTDVTYNSTVTYNGARYSSRALPICTTQLMCAEKCVSRCSDLREFGFNLRSRDQVSAMAKGGTALLMTITNGTGSLEHVIE